MIKNSPSTNVTLSNPPTTNTRKPTTVSANVHTQSIPGATPNVVSSQPMPIAMRRNGSTNVFRSGFIVYSHYSLSGSYPTDISRFISRTAGSIPTNMARDTILCPMFNSCMPSILATAHTLR